MSIFNEKRWLAFETGKFICAKCGATMKFTDKWEDRLLCPKCGYEIELELYGMDGEEEYDALYPILPTNHDEESNEKEDIEKK